MKNFTTQVIIFLIIFLSIHDSSNAGLPSGPYIAWVNLHEDTKPHITKSIREFLKTQQDQAICDGLLSGWVVYTKRRPEGISNELVSKAFDQQDAIARQALVKALKAFRDKPDIDNGLDGVVAYSEANSPHIISLDTHGKIIRSKPLRNANDAEELVNAFCSTRPEVYRK